MSHGARSVKHQIVGGNQYFKDNVQVKGVLQGVKKEVITATANQVLSSDQSGATVILANSITGVKLPTPELGLYYKFVLTADMGSGTATVTSTSDGSSAANLFTGILDVDGGPTKKANVDVITFGDDATEGDYCEVTCVGTGTGGGDPSWHVYCKGDHASSITIA
tara:strand:- start:1456 stop:1950 length:495 start_codon:yes stop_codon:yes gene_type:complete